MEVYKDKKNGNNLLRKSFCAYLDILGFSEKILKNDIQFFNKYLKILNEELKYIDTKHDLSDKNGYKNFELKIFTDNFVFGQPWFNQHGESELGNMFEVLSHIQLTFAKSDIFLRGAISMSDLFMDQNVVIGPAIIESYKLESEKSIYPRIIVSEDVVQVINKHINYYADKKGSPQNNTYLIDIDGYHFLNYLFILFFDSEYTKTEVIKQLIEHKNAINNNLIKYENDFKLFDKYSWSAKYHNYFCKNHFLIEYPNETLDEILIDEKVIFKKISSII
jgi:hypothetical protein